MRYLVNYDGPFADSVELAETLFERFVGRRLAVEQYDESVTLANGVGRLAHTPIARIVSIKATLAANASILPWPVTNDIAPDDVSVNGEVVVFPSSMFGVSYSYAYVVYEAGLVDIPDDVRAVVEEIAYRCAKGDMDEWSGVTSLSDDAQATIARYAKGR